MAADQALLKNSNSNLFGDIDSMRCDRCKSKKKKVDVLCSDCGDLALCSDCNKKVHQEDNKLQHQLQHLRPKVPAAIHERNKLNASVNHKKTTNNIAKLDVIQNDKPHSLLLIDSTEKLQVSKILKVEMCIFYLLKY